jgi:hypothetical protein
VGHSASTVAKHALRSAGLTPVPTNGHGGKRKDYLGDDGRQKLDELVTALVPHPAYGRFQQLTMGHLHDSRWTVVLPMIPHLEPSTWSAPIQLPPFRLLPRIGSLQRIGSRLRMKQLGSSVGGNLPQV